MTNYCEFNGCEYCQQIPVKNYYGVMLCDDCIKMERETDWEQYEEAKRKRIAESQEY